MKKIVTVFMSLVLIVPVSGQIELKQVCPEDIGKGSCDFPAYIGCINYSGEGENLTIIPVESHQDSPWTAYIEGTPPDLNICVKAWRFIPKNPPGTQDIKVADLYVDDEHFYVLIDYGYYTRLTTTEGGRVRGVICGPTAKWFFDIGEPIYLGPLPVGEVWAKPGYKFVGLYGTAVDMGFVYTTPLPSPSYDGVTVWLEMDDYFAAVPEQCYIIGMFAKSIPTELDIKPNSNPNSINLKANGVVPVAILGNEDFDVTDIDTSTILLEGIAPIMWSIEEVLYDNPEYDPVSNPSVPPLIGDGIDDIVFHFLREELRVPLNLSSTTATLTGELLDGTSFVLTDYVNIVKY